MNRPELYERVALVRDVPEHGLRRGDVATVVDVVPHPGGGADGFALEVTNALGESLQVVIMTESDIAPLTANEVFAVRELSRTS